MIQHLLISGILFFTATAHATQCTIEGKVIKVSDGDTVKVLDSKKHTHTIRLAGLDAPEKGQAFGQAARKHLAKIINQKMVCVTGDKRDQYKRLVGVIHLDGKDINLAMITAGYAWHYKRFQREQSKADREEYSVSELAARDNVIGLWSEPDPIKPEDWRKGIRKNPIKEKISFQCGVKKFCKQMKSCAEACFHLTQCGLSRLDGNKDGIPCSNVCYEKCS